ncbi:hypothetical protein SRABI89_05543 [Pseudomonas koreensis]|nr:hypothetical protein SRABI89_05543 [Pseudomonas koreensis]
MGELVAFAVEGFQVVALAQHFLDRGLQRRLFRRGGYGEGHAAGSRGVEDAQAQGFGQALEQFVEVGDFLAGKIEAFQRPAQAEVQRRAVGVLHRVRQDATVCGQVVQRGQLRLLDALQLGQPGRQVVEHRHAGVEQR